jgi:hypothetical protein
MIKQIFCVEDYNQALEIWRKQKIEQLDLIHLYLSGNGRRYSQ